MPPVTGPLISCSTDERNRIIAADWFEVVPGGSLMGRRLSIVGGVIVGLSAALILHAQVPRPPFTAEDAAIGKQLAAKSLEIRAQIKTPGGPAEPFKMIGNLYWVGEQ